MALKFTAYLTDIGEVPDSTQDDLQKLVDQVLRIANKHADFYICRDGDVTVEPGGEER